MPCQTYSGTWHSCQVTRGGSVWKTWCGSPRTTGGLIQLMTSAEMGNTVAVTVPRAHRGRLVPLGLRLPAPLRPHLLPGCFTGTAE